MSVLRLASILVAATAAFCGYAVYRRRPGAMRRAGQRPRHAEPLQRWEGEGGALSAARRGRAEATTGRTDDVLDPGGDTASMAPLSH